MTPTPRPSSPGRSGRAKHRLEHLHDDGWPVPRDRRYPRHAEGVAPGACGCAGGCAGRLRAMIPLPTGVQVCPGDRTYLPRSCAGCRAHPRKGRPCRYWPKASYGPKGPTIARSGGGDPRAAVSSTLPIAAPAFATASRELCPLDAGRPHVVRSTGSAAYLLLLPPFAAIPFSRLIS